MRTPIIVTEKYEIIDGFRRVEAMTQLGKEYIEVWIDDVEPTIFERIIRNMYRTKTTDDQVKELKYESVSEILRKNDKTVEPSKLNRIIDDIVPFIKKENRKLDKKESSP
jgi:ParB-like chromosome segregation protein Spo0J